MKKGDVVQTVRLHTEDILKQIAAGQIVEVKLAATDEEAQAIGWPSASIMQIGITQLREALPATLREYLKIIPVERKLSG